MASKKSVAAEAVVEMLDEPLAPEAEAPEAEAVEAEAPEEVKSGVNPLPHYSIRAFPGDSYLTIAERLVPDGKAVSEFARELRDYNRSALVRAGAKINIPN